MAPFHEIAVPHRDILAKNFSSEVYAAKLWDVYNKQGHDEYVDPEIFFAKTFLTENMQQILDSIEDRLYRNTGGHFRSIATPFGGGKTHTLIALYHKCLEWGAKPIIFVGNEMDPNKQTLWGQIEEQLTGKINDLQGNIPRGGEALRKVLKQHDQPILILIDELLQYVIKASGVQVGESTLADQTIVFIQELGEAVSNFSNICVVVTLPSSSNEQLDNEKYTILNNKLEKFASRTKDTITPISDGDIPQIIRRRLFSSSDEEIRHKAKKIINNFVQYCEDEGLIPEGMSTSQYREEFFHSYPFLPQVIKVLYQRWGTITTFQRTRGVLRFLSLVINSLATSEKEFISLGDIKLENNEIRQELIDYIDPQFHGVISKDIVGDDSGAAKVNQLIQSPLRGKRLGTKVATAIFMYSHSGATAINGATESEIKRATCVPDIPSAQISEIINLFRNHLFYLNISHEKYFFTTEANILKIKVDIIENIKENEIIEAERYLIKNNISELKNLRTVVWPKQSQDIEKSHYLKLVIMKEDNIDLIQSIYKTVGKNPRIYKNNIFFLVPSEEHKEKFITSLKNKIAWEKIKTDQYLPLKEDQKQTLDHELKKVTNELNDLIKEYYSTVYVPDKNKLMKHNLGIIHVTNKNIDEIIYEYLVDESEIHPRLSSLLLRNHYLKDTEYVETYNLFESMLRTPGERRPISIEVVKTAIIEGALNGEFGVGELNEDELTLKFFKEYPQVSFEPGEILLNASLCENQTSNIDHNIIENKLINKNEDNTLSNDDPINNKPLSHDINIVRELNFNFIVPEGQINQISKLLLKIATHYNHLELSVKASNGSMVQHDLDLIKEALEQIKSSSSLS